ncbi:DUF6077 domain-containing protein [Actinomadura sp. 6K520]|uniref:DUF6077 domain-containing protein n=1 Tax=Actinomadura sp. 6K520 TaxID=2530364 RepID=UPI00105034FD|nr:DUF6077 domain-containing protein [Actinomadura sp. 6K520]TDE32858.1 hypothetical protein E1289_13995 [Actinomadura sp. 6K520]
MVQLLDRAAETRLRRPDETRTTRLVDGLSDAAVVLFAAWTVVYHLGLLLRSPTWALLLAWLAAAGALAALYATGRAWWEGGPLWRERARRAARRPRRSLAVVAVAAGAAAGTCAGLYPSGVPWWCTWLCGTVSVAAAAAYLLPRLGGRNGANGDGRDGDRAHADEGTGDEDAGYEDAGYEDHGEEPARRGTPLALLTGAGFAVASLFIVNSDGDDAYFVSRSVATAATGEIPLKDVIFTPGTADEIAGEPPVASVEVLAGALARVLGAHAASFLWYLMLPAAVFLAVWALWRLVRAWAPRRAALCFAVAAAYLLLSGTNSASLGSFHLPRMWQGKAMLVSVLVPLLFVYLTRWAERRSRRDLALLTAAGITAVGLTSSAAFVVPLVVGAAAVPLLAAGRVRTGLAACAAAAYPIAAGLAVMLFNDDTSVAGRVHDAPSAYGWVLLQGVLGVLAGCALWLSPWTARRGVPALIATGVAAVLTALVLPGVLHTAADLSGAGQVLWRTMWAVPAPVLIGLLATVRIPAARPGPARLAAAGPAAALAVALAAGGVPVWSASNGSAVAARPSWKISGKAAGTAREVVALAGPGGLVLMPSRVMRAVPLLTVGTHAVNPNGHYLRSLPAPRRFVDDRKVLTAAVRDPRGGKPRAAEVRAALERTGVDVACAWRRDERALELLRAAGYGGARRVGPLSCLVPPGR